jgi:DNA (cytosine-5)-methyltransferase 1
MIGFKDAETPFEFPTKRPLAFDMSDVMKGDVDREIGFTLRVSGSRVLRTALTEEYKVFQLK